MTPTPGITALLRQAEKTALEKMSGQPVTTGPGGTLEQLGEIIHTIIMGQILAGLWDDQGVHEFHQMVNLRVAVVFGNPLVGEPPLKVEYDFARTTLPTLVVKRAR